MSLFPSPNMNMVEEQQVMKAPQACTTCRKQKRKCNKALPACALCERMNRHCDYSDSRPPPTTDDFNALQIKVMQLESRLNGQPTPYPTSSGADGLGAPVAVYNTPHDIPWQAVQNRFPAIAFLDSEAFKYGGVTVPRPTVEIPSDVLELLGDGASVQATISDYFSTIHTWMPIVSQKRLTRNMANPMWEAGPDLALLFLCMKLITSRPQDGIECSQNHIYMSAKRFVALMEATGTASLLVLQANLLVTWYEYGQAIYPAAWMSAGWCVRYGNMLGINGHEEATTGILPPMNTWVEQEERRRTWWGVLLVDRIVSLGSQYYILSSQEPKKEDLLPANDSAWEMGEISAGSPSTSVGTSVTETIAPFPRLCQAFVLMGKTLNHHHGETTLSEKEHFSTASYLYSDICELAQKLSAESHAPGADFLGLIAPLSLSYSALCVLCDKYSCLKGCNPTTPEGAAMQAQAVDGLKTVSHSIVQLAGEIDEAATKPQDLDRVSPIVMDAMYAAAANYAWLVRESGAESSQVALDTIRYILRKLGSRWRNAAEYLRILEAKEFTYAMNNAGT